MSPHVELVIMWEAFHLQGSHHDIANVVMRSDDPFRAMQRSSVILSRNHWLLWNAFQSSQLCDKVQWCRPPPSQAEFMIGCGPNQLMHCGITPELGITHPTISYARKTSNSQTQGRARWCCLRAAPTHFECGLWIPWSTLAGVITCLHVSIVYNHHLISHCTTRRNWWYSDCIRSHSTQWLLMGESNGIPGKPFVTITLDYGPHACMAPPCSSYL